MQVDTHKHADTHAELGADICADTHADTTDERLAFSLERVRVSFGEACALADVTLSAHTGEYIAILGANGSGKSTLAKVIAGLLAPDEGHVCLLDRCVLHDGRKDFNSYARAQAQLGYVFQNPDDQFVTQEAAADIAFGPENLELDSDEITKRVTRELTRTQLMAYAHTDPFELSGGQKQRLALAGALALDPEILVLDEPAAQLDLWARKTLLRTIRSYAQAGATIVHVTHLMEDVLDATRVIVLDKGHITYDTTPDVLFSDEERLRALGLSAPLCFRIQALCNCHGLDMPPIRSKTACAQALARKLNAKTETTAAKTETEATATAKVANETAAKATAKVENETILNTTSEPTCACTRATAPAPASQSAAQPRAHTLLSLDRLSFCYERAEGAHEGSRGVSDITLQIERGKRYALIGEGGSGKSTLLRIISGLIAAKTGTIHYGNQTLTPASAQNKLLTHVGFVMQNPEKQLFSSNIQEDIARVLTSRGWSAHDAAQKAEQALAAVGLLDKKDRSPFCISRGEARKAAVAQVLAMGEALMLFDEITSGLDPYSARDVFELMITLPPRYTCIYTTHNMEEAAQADYIYVLHEGSLVMQGTPAMIFQPQNEAQLKSYCLGLPLAEQWAAALMREGGLNLDICMTRQDLLHNLDALLESKGFPKTASSTQQKPRTASQQEYESLPQRESDPAANPQLDQAETRARAPLHTHAHTPLHADQITLPAFPSMLCALNPCLKICLVSIYLVLAFTCSNIIELASAAVGALAFMVMAKLSPKRLVRALLPFVYVLICVFLCNCFFIQEGNPILSIGPCTLYSQGVYTSFIYAARMLLALCVVHVMLTSTQTTEFAHAFETLFEPLRSCGFPNRELGCTFALMLRFVPLLSHEAKALIDTVRCQEAAHASRKSSTLTLITYAHRILPALFASALIHAQLVAQALDARHYRAERKRSSWKRMEFGKREWLVLLASGIYLCLHCFLALHSSLL